MPNKKIKSLESLLKKRFISWFGLLTVIFIGLLFINQVLWNTISNKKAENDISISLGRTLSNAIDNSDLIALQNIVGGFQSANPDASICLRLPSGERIVYGSDCNWAQPQIYYSPLKHTKYEISVKIIDSSLPYHSIISSIGLAAVFLILSLQILHIRRNLIEDLSGFRVQEKPRNYSELEELFTVIEVQKKRLVESKKFEAITKTAGMLAHDIRRPFSLIKSIVFMLNNDPSPSMIDKVSQDYLPEIDTAVKDVNAMIEDIMEAGSGNSTFIRNNFSYLLLLKECLRFFSKNQSDKRISFKLNYNAPEFLLGNSSKIKRAINNMLANAIEASPSDSDIVLIVIEKKGIITTRITNKGPYLPKTVTSQIFDAFYTNGKENGTGLGLAITKQIIENHQGNICCESQRDGMTSFIFSLPHSQLESTQLTSTKITVDSFNGEKAYPRRKPSTRLNSEQISVTN